MVCSGLAESVVAAAFSRVGQRVLHVDRSVLMFVYQKHLFSLTCQRAASQKTPELSEDLAVIRCHECVYQYFCEDLPVVV